VLEQREEERAQRHAAAGQEFPAAVAKISIEHRREVARPDPAAGQLLPVAGFGEEWLRTKQTRRPNDGLLERLVLEGVQRVVMDEDVDRTLRGQKPGGAVDRPPDLLGTGRAIHQAAVRKLPCGRGRAENRIFSYGRVSRGSPAALAIPQGPRETG
jgi:hypothetical protein